VGHLETFCDPALFEAGTNFLSMNPLHLFLFSRPKLILQRKSPRLVCAAVLKNCGEQTAVRRRRSLLSCCTEKALFHEPLRVFSVSLTAALQLSFAIYFSCPSCKTLLIISTRFTRAGVLVLPSTGLRVTCSGHFFTRKRVAWMQGRAIYEGRVQCFCRLQRPGWMRRQESCINFTLPSMVTA